MAVVDLDRFIGIPEAAERLGISRSNAYDLIHRDLFPVPVQDVAGRQRVSLRRLAEHMYGAAILDDLAELETAS